jgi:NNP family nitrate/nitrite transporter-like MFS transporter
MASTGIDQLKARYGLRGTPTTGVVGATWGFFIGFAAVALYGPAAHDFQSTMQLSGVRLGLLVAAPQLTGSLLRIPFGAWVDKGGGRKPMLTLFTLSLVGMAGLVGLLEGGRSLTGSMYPLVLLCGFLSGCGVASFSVGIPQVSYWYPQNRQGTMLGIYGGLGNLAPGLFTLLLPFAIAGWGLAGSYLAWFIFLGAGTLVYAAFARDAYFFQLRKKGVAAAEARQVALQFGQELFPREGVWRALRVAAAEPRTWGLVFLYFISFGGFLALTVWFPSYWVNAHHFSPRMAGVLGGLGFSLLAAIIRVYGGGLSEARGGERVAVGAFALVLVGALVLSLAESVGVCVAGEILIALGMGVGNAAVFKLVPKYVPDAVGGAAGWVGGLGAAGGFVIPPLLGAIVDLSGGNGYATGFLVYVVLAIGAIGVASRFARHDAAR